MNKIIVWRDAGVYAPGRVRAAQQGRWRYVGGQRHRMDNTPQQNAANVLIFSFGMCHIETFFHLPNIPAHALYI